MKKGLIIINLPDNCRKGPLRSLADDCIVGRNVMEYRHEGRSPEWCPIKELPDEKEPTGIPLSPMLPRTYTEYEQGWNDCLKTLNQTD